MFIVQISNKIIFNRNVEQIKQSLLSNQFGNGLDDIRVNIRPSRQYNKNFCDVIRSCFRTIVPVIMRAVKTLFKTSSESLKTGSLIGHLFKLALKPTLRTAFKHDNKALGNLIQNQTKPSAGPTVRHSLIY